MLHYVFLLQSIPCWQRNAGLIHMMLLLVVIPDNTSHAPWVSNVSAVEHPRPHCHPICNVCCRAGDENGYHALPDLDEELDEERGKGATPSQGDADAYREEVTLSSFVPCLHPLPLTPHTSFFLTHLTRHTHLPCQLLGLLQPSHMHCMMQLPS